MAQVKEIKDTEIKTSTQVCKENTTPESNRHITGLIGIQEDRPTINKPSKSTLKQLRDRDRELVKGVFKYYENQGGILKFSIKLYKEDKIETYELADNGVYTLPRGVARHLNTNTYYPVYEHSRVAKDVSGIESLRIKSKVFRTGFHPLDFTDLGSSEQQSNLTIAER